LTAFSQVDSSANNLQQDSIKLSYCQAQEIAVEILECDSIAMELTSTQSMLQTALSDLELKNKTISTDSVRIHKLKTMVSAESDKSDIYEGLLVDEQKKTTRLQRTTQMLGVLSLILTLTLLLNSIKY